MKSFTTIGYFIYMGDYYSLIKVDGNMLEGNFITPVGAVHTLHIGKDNVEKLVILKSEEELEEYRKTLDNENEKV